MKAVIIDDEAAARAELASLLEEFCPSISIVDNANGVEAGLAAIEKIHPDLIFLDINMTDGTGFDLVRKLKVQPRPEIIFVSSINDRSLDAIRCSAIGYVIKPIELPELLRAVRIAEQRITEKGGARRLEALLENLSQENNLEKPIGIPTEQGVDFYSPGEIIRCEAVERYTKIILTEGRSFLSSYSIGEYVKTLEPRGFIYIHRAHLVNITHIRRLDRAGSIEMHNGDTLPVSRRKRTEVMKIITG